jgi:hypothetical protein
MWLIRGIRRKCSRRAGLMMTQRRSSSLGHATRPAAGSPLAADVDDLLDEIDVVVLEGEHFARAHCCFANGEDRAFDDQPVFVGAAGARAMPQPLVLLVGDDLEVGSVDPPPALAGAEAGERVAVDQFAIERVVEELADGLLDVGATGECPGHSLVAAEAVHRPLAELPDKRPQRLAHASHR